MLLRTDVEAHRAEKDPCLPSARDRYRQRPQARHAVARGAIVIPRGELVDVRAVAAGVIALTGHAAEAVHQGDDTGAQACIRFDERIYQTVSGSDRQP